MKLNYLLNKTALHIAIEKGNLEIVEMLLNNKNIDVNSIKINFKN